MIPRPTSPARTGAPAPATPGERAVRRADLLAAARHRHWLTAQAVLALLVNHLLYTGW
ncbi:hypothetical protein [Streptomyces natalensis]|uniref:hypothetical protein n=1 Tax=Streptomyces natalensis TaxID=68242 RepID=UPI0012FF1244|nr:hypothetical protein [Streptomyces natalensis]